MKTAISIPDSTFKAADELACRLGISRSQLYSRAVQKYIESESQSAITEQLNKIYAEEDSSVDPVMSAIQFASIPKEDW